MNFFNWRMMGLARVSFAKFNRKWLQHNFILLNKGQCIRPTLKSVFLSLEIVFGLITVINSEYLARYSSLNLHFYDNHRSVDWMDSEECKITWPTTAESWLGRKWICVRKFKDLLLNTVFVLINLYSLMIQYLKL